MSVCVEWALVVDGARGAGLDAAERLVAALPCVAGADLRGCELAYDAGSGWLAAIARLAPGAGDGAHARRLAFWSREAGAEALRLEALSGAERATLRARVGAGAPLVSVVAPAELPAAARGFFTACGAPPDRRVASCRPELVLDLDADDRPRWRGDGLFVPRARAPEPRDPLLVTARAAGVADLSCLAEVRAVRRPEAASPGLPAGFTLALQAPQSALVRELEARCGDAARPPRLERRTRRALVVDDDGFTRRILGDALAERGFEVLTAADGDAGLRRLADEVLSLDLLLTDLRMPVMDGAALVRTVRRAGEADLAVVIVTGDPGVEGALEREGADAVLQKALGAELIARAAEAVVARKRGAAAA